MRHTNITCSSHLVARLSAIAAITSSVAACEGVVAMAETDASVRPDTGPRRSDAGATRGDGAPDPGATIDAEAASDGGLAIDLDAFVAPDAPPPALDAGPPPPLGPVLYVAETGSDSGDGTRDRPFRTIARADRAATRGVTVIVLPGSYPGGFETTASGTADEPIVFRSEVRHQARIDSGGTAQAWWSKGEHVEIVGFEVDGAGTNWRIGLYASGSHTTLRGNDVHDILRSPEAVRAVGGSGGAAIEGDNYYGATDIHVIGNRVHRIGPPDAESSLVHGIYEIASGTVANNVVYDVCGTGIQLWHDAHDMVIVNNTVYGSRNGGIMVGAGDRGIGGGGLSARAGDYVTVVNNIVVDSEYGLWEYGRTGVHNVYLDNLVYDNAVDDVLLLNGLVDTGTIVASPGFVDATAADFRLAAGSRAIDSGSEEHAPEVDIEGVARSLGEGPDRGAFESR
jgi:hypothetical protein